MIAPSHPVLLYDGRCGFCKRHVERWRALTGDRVEYLPYQAAGSQFDHIGQSNSASRTLDYYTPDLSVEALSQAVHLVMPDGQVLRGAAAVFRLRSIGTRRSGLEFLYEYFPPFRVAADVGYAWIAGHRNFVDAIDWRLFGKEREPISYRLTRSIYLRALGVIYLFAFVSLWVQIDGLIGSRGILPIGEAMDYARQQLSGPSRFFMAPTLCWISSSDAFLHFLCAGGTVMAVLLMLGVLPGVMLVGLWVFYLSLTIAGQTFLEFQWDILLLEAGFASILLVPAQVWMRWRTAAEPSRIAIWMIRWLAFRIMFLSGITKILSHDPSWRNGTALTFHWWTQPIPPWTAWYLAKAPLWFDIIACCVMFFAELIAPWLIFTPRKVRRIGFWSIVLFQVLILLTGNYGFFNLLTIVICIPLLDDAFWPKWLRRGAVYSGGSGYNSHGDPTLRSTSESASDFKLAHHLIPIRFASQWRLVVIAPIAGLLIILTIVEFFGQCEVNIGWPQWVVALDGYAEPFRSANGYGLFRVMTTSRPEIIIEGSNDGEHWKAYEFKYKPGDLTRRPAFFTPHMPRLDWQMWFEALGGEPDPWFRSFLHQLLVASPPVLGLMRENPFPDHPPRYLRCTLYEYHFSQTHEDGKWWQRKMIGPFTNVIQLNTEQENSWPTVQ